MPPYPALTADGSEATLAIGPEAAVRFVAPASVAWLTDRCANGFHEPVLSALVVDVLSRRPQSVFVDAGALYGYFALLAAAASHGQATVHAFEMNPESATALRENVAASPAAGRISVVHAALGAMDAPAEPTRYRGFIIGSHAPDARQAAIDFVTLDTYFAQRPAPQLMKVDVEGYEGRLLEGARGLMAAHDPIILLELHAERALRRQGDSRRRLLQDLLGRGYRAYLLGNHRVAREPVAVPVTTTAGSGEAAWIESGADDLVVICRGDLRDTWPGVTIGGW
jgi:FkbM family methyltransferase